MIRTQEELERDVSMGDVDVEGALNETALRIDCLEAFADLVRDETREDKGSEFVAELVSAVHLFRTDFGRFEELLRSSKMWRTPVNHADG
jgi:hypothetical protein